MSVRSITLAGRRAALRNMTSTVHIFLRVEELNDATGLMELTDTTIYVGPGKVQFFDSAYEQSPEAGAHTFVVDRSFLHLPVSVTGVTIGHLVEVTADALNPHLLGHIWRITNLPPKSHQTALRLPIEEVAA